MENMVPEEPPRTIAEWIDYILAALGSWLLVAPFAVLGVWRIAAWMFGYAFPYTAFHNQLGYATIPFLLIWSFYRFLVLRVEAWASRRSLILAGAALHRKRRIAISFMLVAWFIIAIPLTMFLLIKSGDMPAFNIRMRELWQRGSIDDWFFFFSMMAPWLLPLPYNVMVLWSVARGARKIAG